MAVEMRAEVPGMTAAQAQAVLAQVGDQLKTRPGFIAHASGPIEGGYRVTEFWESQEAQERWMQEVMLPLMQQMGGMQPPAVQYLPATIVITR